MNNLNKQQYLQLKKETRKFKKQTTKGVKNGTSNRL